MARTFKDVPYKVRQERHGIEDKWLRPRLPGQRKHVFDVIFYAHELGAISEFNKHLHADSRFDAAVTEVKGHLISGRPDWPGSFFSPKGMNGVSNEELFDVSRISVGYSKPAGDLFANYTFAHKSNVFVIYQVFRVREAREAVLEIEKSIPYWSPYYGGCRCDWCIDPRRDQLGKREVRQLDTIAKDFNSGVPLDDLDDGLL